MKSKVLVVDDQPGIRMLLEEILNSEGYETITAKTGKEACDLADEYSLDLIIMDYNLPVMHGRDVLKELDMRNIAYPVIVITGLTKESIQAETEFPFVHDIISKPFDIQILKEMVGYILISNR